MSFISSGLKIGAIVTAAIAILIGIFVGTTIPKDIGFYRWLKTKIPKLVGLGPAFLPYGEEEWEFTYEDLALTKDLVKGQRAIVTGANSGIGYATAQQLHKLGVEVIMACRNPTKCQKAANDIIKTNSASTSGGSTTDGGTPLLKTMTIDTGSLASVKKFAQDYLAEYSSDDQPLDMLFLNAGFCYSNYKDPTACVPLSVDGIELVFATNYLGHHLLYRLLEPSLQRAKMARIVSTSSMASYRTFPGVGGVATDLTTLNSCPQAGFGLFTNSHILSYGQSKLAQIVWSKKVTRRNGPTSTQYVNAYHPGAVATEVWANSFAIGQAPQILIDVFDWLQRVAMWTPDEGALTGLFLGTSLNELKLGQIRGKYYHPQSIEMENELANNSTLQDKLWEFSEHLVKDYLILEGSSSSRSTTKEEDNGNNKDEEVVVEEEDNPVLSER